MDRFTCARAGRQNAAPAGERHRSRLLRKVVLARVIGDRLLPLRDKRVDLP